MFDTAPLTELWNVAGGGPVPRDLLSEKIASCGYPAGIRGEALDLTGFSRIADALAPHLGAPIQT